jgi:hypothetical protein
VTGGAWHVAVRAKVAHVFFKLASHELNPTLVGTVDHAVVTSRQMSLEGR